MKYEPIFISGCARSGTSFTASLFHAHGVFIGKARSTKYPSSNTLLGTERTEFKPIVKELLGANNYHSRRKAPLPENNKTIPGLRERVLALYPDDKPFLIKSGGLLLFYDVFREAFPDAFWVLPIGPLDDVVNSILNHPAMGRTTPDRRQLVKYVRAVHARQADIDRDIDSRSCIFSTHDAILSNNYGCLPGIISGLGLEYSDRTMAEIINPEMWHTKASA